jgi:hypothetical protein
MNIFPRIKQFPFLRASIPEMCEKREHLQAFFGAFSRYAGECVTRVDEKGKMRRFPRFDDTPDPAQRRHNIVQLHAEGWSVASIASIWR